VGEACRGHDAIDGAVAGAILVGGAIWVASAFLATGALWMNAAHALPIPDQPTGWRPLVPALLLALTVHALLLFGLSFRPPAPAPDLGRPLEVMVLRQPPAERSSPTAPEALAQRTQEGSGTGADTSRAPGSPADFAKNEASAGSEELDGTEATGNIKSGEMETINGIDGTDEIAGTTGREVTQKNEGPDWSIRTDIELSLDVSAPRAANPPQEPQLSSDLASNLRDAQQPPELVASPAETPPEPEPSLIKLPATNATAAQAPLPTAGQILASRGQEIAKLSAKIEEETTAYANRPRRKAISASTQEYKYASYLEAWRRKVESIGNLNYPEEAKRQKLYGNLILRVALRADGSLEEVRVLRSSGSQILDEAAVRIVHLAAPFAPFPPDIRQETDFLDITRTWQFLSNNRFGEKR